MRDRFARIVSIATFPLLMPTYALAIVFLCSYMHGFDAVVLWTVTSAAFGLTAVVPGAGIFIMYRLGKVTDPALNKQRERLLPFVITILAYFATAFYFTRLRAPHWMSAFMVGASVALAIAAVINLRWKISGHSMGMGGLTALSLFLAVKGYLVTFGFALPLGLILLSGLVGTCRLLLGRHTLGQVGAGYVLGFAAIYISMLI
ncbi:MAG: hypothetical protein K2I64_05365 [Muribaculaceae bacterium]|nr:hypothetical protein [Muribaculaceae bacterium]